MPNQFTNIDFSFRRGTKDGLDRAVIKNGSLNFSTDTEEMMVDIDNKRLNLSSVVHKENEAAIRSVENPGDKLYIAEDTRKLMYNLNGVWYYASGSTNATTTADGLMSTTDKTKLDGIDVGAEVNQNAFSNVIVNGNNLTADTKTDSVSFTFGDGLAVTTNIDNDSVTVDIKTWTGTKASYDAITTKDPNTFYFING